MPPRKPNDARTSALLRQLSDAPDLEQFIETNADILAVPSLPNYLAGLCAASGEAPERVILRAGIERTYGHQLFNGTRNPSRDKVIQLAFGLQLDVDGAQKLLQVAHRNPLYPKIKRDAAILYCLQRGLDVFEAQSLLHSLGLTMLGGDAT